MNIGSAVRSQMFNAPQTFVAKTGPGGAGAASTIAKRPTPISEKPTHNPVASNPNSATISNSDSGRISIYSSPSMPVASSAAMKAGMPPRSRTSSNSISATASRASPKVITPCGSQSGILMMP